MSYTHLTAQDRYQIYELRVQGYSQRKIAHLMQRSASTISREVRRNVGERGYRPKQADHKAQARLHAARGGKKVCPKTAKACFAFIREGFSPAQASGRCRRLHLGSVSHEWLYLEVYRQKACGGTLWKHLRCQKLRRKRYGANRRRRGRIPQRIGIEQRCKRVESRASVGHWEMDLVKDSFQRGFVVTMLERKTGYALTRWVKSKHAELVADAIIGALKPLGRLVRTMTFDNGLEFAQHQRIGKACGAKTYFADPFSSNQRASNENYNGLLRQYIPKRNRASSFHPNQLPKIQARLNNRARKRLDWQTPFEALLTSATYQGVALAS